MCSHSVLLRKSISHQLQVSNPVNCKQILTGEKLKR